MTNKSSGPVIEFPFIKSVKLKTCNYEKHYVNYLSYALAGDYLL